MSIANQNPDLARAFPTSDAQEHRRTLARNGRRLPYQERIRLRKIAQRRKRKRVEEVKGTIRIATLNVGSMTGRGQEIVDLMDRRRINIMCVQETKWKGCKAKEIGNGFKLFYNGNEGKRNGVGIILNDDIKKGVLSVKRRSDRIIWMRVDLEGEIVNIMSAYAPQMGCDEEEKTQFWEDLEEDLREIPESERLWIGGDFNGHCGSNNRGKEDTIGIYGVGVSNVAGDQLVDFAMSHSLRIVNTFFKKAERHRITYKSGDAESQIDYILCRMSDRGNIKDCKVILGESVTSQHRPLICTLGRSITPRRKEIGVQRTKWWKLADKDTQSQFVAAARDKLQQSERQGNRSFEEVTEDLRKLGERLLGRTSGKCKPGKETWWWNDEVQESLKRKKEAKKTLDMENNDVNKEIYKLAKKEAKKSVARAKARAYQVLYEDMETIDGQKRALRMAKQRDKNSKDIYQTKLIKDGKGNVLVENAEILKRWQEYFNKLMNEENPRDSRQETQRVVEKVTSEITGEEVEKALKKMKNGKAVGPDNLPIEVWKSLGIIGIEYLKQELNNIMEKEKIPDEWRKSTLIPIFKNKGDIMECSNYRGIKLMSHSMKLYERVQESRLRNIVEISDEQFGFMKGKSTTDAIFVLRQLQEKFREGQEDLHSVFIDLEKAYDRVPREELYWCMRDKGVPEKYIRVVKDMYKQCVTEVKCAVGTTQTFPVEVGLHQGSALSPFLFAIIMDSLTKDCRKKAPWNMMFADDVVLCAREKRELEEDLEQWRDALERRGMKISRSKTEYMCLNGTSTGSVEMLQRQLPETMAFKYLGSTLETDGGVGAEVNRRIQCGWNNWKKMSGILCDKSIPSKVKGRIHMMVIQPAMIYGMETVPLGIRDTKRLEVAEMKMCRWACGHTLKDHVRNEVIREKLGIIHITTQCRKARLRWFGHVKRRDEEYAGRSVLEMAPPGRRRRGRPKLRWMDCLRKDLEEIEAKEEDALDRETWRKRIAAATL